MSKAYCFSGNEDGSHKSVGLSRDKFEPDDVYSLGYHLSPREYLVMYQDQLGVVNRFFVDSPYFLTGYTGLPTGISGPEADKWSKPYKTEFLSLNQEHSEEVKKRMAELKAMTSPENICYNEEAAKSFPHRAMDPEVIKARIAHNHKKTAAAFKKVFCQMLDTHLQSSSALPVLITEDDVNEAVRMNSDTKGYIFGGMNAILETAKEYLATKEKDSNSKFDVSIVRKMKNGEDPEPGLLPAVYKSLAWDVLRIRIGSKKQKTDETE